MEDEYKIRRAKSSDDAKKLHALFSDVFYPEDVGTFAETMFHYFPHMGQKYWFIVEEKKTNNIVSAFALIPWTWEMEGTKLSVAEMGIVGTQEKHRGRGLFRRLNNEFDKTLEKERFDLAVIQGIPGFYHRFGYNYSIPLENQINMPLHLIPGEQEEETYSFRLASVKDIPYLLQDDKNYRDHFSISAFRDEANWKYLLTQSPNTEYGSEYWIMEDLNKQEKFYCRIQNHGFGSGLILSEISDCITYNALSHLFSFCKERAIERNKPYIRLNLHQDSTAGKIAISMGAEQEKIYAWQIKIPNTINLLIKMGSILEKRIMASSFRNFSGTLRLNFFKTKVDLLWKGGNLESVLPGEGDCKDTFSINADLFPALCLGHRTWREIQYIRPDISPASGKSALLIETLFPPGKSWIYEQY